MGSAAAQSVTVLQWTLRNISAFGSGALGVLLRLGSVAPPEAYHIWMSIVYANALLKFN